MTAAGNWQITAMLRYPVAMNTPTDWRNAVQVRRATALADERAMQGGRTTVFDFSGIGGSEKAWVGSVHVAPGSNTGPHTHGRHEVMIHAVRGRSEIRWGARLEYAIEIGPGDAVYFAPHVPHQERSLETTEMVEYLVVRSDNEKIANQLPDVQPVENPQCF
ncbi:cupin domain-containing protein [Ferrovibrio terrae]|uniref:Cupin domain-containing protein n=1 Tax=Ferrovibrio terrae TaxID=2594003 RepID=A0A516GZH8_9PROT|nr:cupin domain-containing protein [Ferrovibrio terrae]QDO96936.1 cupin domain-containing protein [Ferrovibrio terrae]